jgi:hypothetical protein
VFVAFQFSLSSPLKINSKQERQKKPIERNESPYQLTDNRYHHISPLVTLTTLTWIGKTGNQTVDVAWDNGRNTGYSVACQVADVCTGKYYPKRVDITVPATSYASNYTVSNLQLLICSFDAS